VRVSDLSPDRRKLLVPVSGRANVKALVPPRCPHTLDALPVLDLVVAAEPAITSTAAVARLLPRPDLITRSLERREMVLSSQIEDTQTDLTQLLEYEATGSNEGLPDDAAVTLGYVRALDHGLRTVRRADGPRHLTLGLIRQLHSVLMRGATTGGIVEDTCKKWSQAGVAAQASNVRECRPLRTPDHVLYVIENTSLSGDHRPTHFRTPRGEPPKTVRAGSLKVIRPWSQAIVIRKKTAPRRRCDQFLHVSSTYPCIADMA
jgi:hypothetical protein